MNEETLALRVEAIFSETPDAKTFALRPADGSPVSYQAGQFLTFLFNFHGHEVRRSYSMSSAPGVDEALSVTVKRVENGEASRFLLDRVRVGDTLRALPPSGRFVLDDSAGPLVLLGAGSGITPLFSLLKMALATQPARAVLLLYASRDARSTMFREPLATLARQHPDRLTLLHQYSAEGQRLNNARLETLLRRHLGTDPADARFYLCGPSDFMRMARITLLFMGFHADQLRQEHFVVETPPAPPLLAVPSRVTLVFRGKTHVLDVPAGQYLLTAALDAGLPLPYSCRGGRCATCVARCRSGQVAMRINDVLTARDLSAGLVLTCTGYAESGEVTLDV
jgi:ring-1,2-phenylacetyl-CoA epoxidase subunit PaaE